MAGSNLVNAPSKNGPMSAVLTKVVSSNLVPWPVKIGVFLGVAASTDGGLKQLLPFSMADTSILGLDGYSPRRNPSGRADENGFLNDPDLVNIVSSILGKPSDPAGNIDLAPPGKMVGVADTSLDGYAVLSGQQIKDGLLLKVDDEEKKKWLDIGVNSMKDHILASNRNGYKLIKSNDSNGDGGGFKFDGKEFELKVASRSNHDTARSITVGEYEDGAVTFQSNFYYDRTIKERNADKYETRLMAPVTGDPTAEGHERAMISYLFDRLHAAGKPVYEVNVKLPAEFDVKVNEESYSSVRLKQSFNKARSGNQTGDSALQMPGIVINLPIVSVMEEAGMSLRDLSRSADGKFFELKFQPTDARWREVAAKIVGAMKQFEWE